MSSTAIDCATIASKPNQQMVRSEAKYRGLLEAAPDAMVVVDEGGVIVLVNVQTEKQFGYPRDELIGRKVTDIIPSGFAERLIADGSRSAAEALAQHMGTGIELVALRKDGGEFPIEIMLSPLRSTDGVLITAAIRDISTRKAAEELMRRAEQRYRGLLEAVPDSMVVVSPCGERGHPARRRHATGVAASGRPIGLRGPAVLAEHEGERMPLVIIADDDQLVVDVVRAALEARGHVVSGLSDGKPVSTVVELKGPDVVILDCSMAEVSGIVALKQIRASAKSYATPVLMLTSRCGAADENIALAAGADDYLRKPFDPEELVVRVEALMSKSSPAGAQAASHHH